MKKGLLVYNSLGKTADYYNIGDIIQSLSALQFIKVADYFVNREQLNNFSKEKILLIMNGWFMHNPQNWPPSYLIEPLLISFHINEYAKEELTSNQSIDFFKKNQPIGCRDYNTMNILKEKGVDAYFSGCLTLTLNESISSSNVRHGVCIVDPIVSHYNKISLSLVKILVYFFTLMSQFKTIYKIYFKIYESANETKNSLKEKFRVLYNAITLFRTYKNYLSKDILINSDYYSHIYKDGNLNEEEKIVEAKRILNKYASASLVITSRIHCALPCLAFETPVIFIQNVDEGKYSDCRFGGLLELLNVVKVSYNSCRVISSSFDQNLILERRVKNSDHYRLFQEKLKNDCDTFIKSYN